MTSKESRPGLVLLGAAIVALIWANTSFSGLYFEIVNYQLMGHSFVDWVNDALMAIFFFVVAAEIKRELTHGELASRKKAALPLIAALGGVILPALIYFGLNSSGEGSRGWGIPMATDIAFAVGIFVLVGRGISSALRTLLLSLAIVDDLMAVVVIALFYTEKISGPSLALAAGAVLIILIAHRLKLQNLVMFIVLGLVVWLAFFKSGFHPTLAGVAMGFLSPNDEWPHKLEPWVNFLIVPLFALTNAGVAIDQWNAAEILVHPVFLGVALGLVVGKSLGIWGASLLSEKLGLAELPRGIHGRHLWAMGCLGGIGFTMALFISHLAFAKSPLEAVAKVGILAGSLVSGILGTLFLSFARARHS